MSFPSYVFVYEIFLIPFLFIPIFWVCTMELGELKLRDIRLEIFPIYYNTILIVTLKKGKKKKKNNPLNDKLSTP